MPDLRFDDRVAVVTGGGRGLGRSYAMLLASQGAKVVVNDPGGSLTGDGTDAAPAEEVVREIVAAGGDAVANTDSVATPSGGKAIIDAALDRYGRIDILVHNAGNVRRASLKEMSYDDFEAVLDVHLRGAFHVVRPAFPLMCDAGYGRIVLTSSIGGLYGNHEVANYAVAKAGVIGLSNVAAIEGAARGRQEQCHRARGSHQNGRGHRHVGVSTDGPGACGARRRLARARILFHHRRDTGRTRRSGGTGGRRGNAGGVPAVVVHGGRRRTTWRRSATRRIPSSFPWYPTATATTSGTASAWQRKEPSVASQGPLAGVRVVDLTAMVMGPVLHPDHGRHGCGRDQGRAACGRQHPLHLGGTRPWHERGLHQREPRQAQPSCWTCGQTRARTALRALVATADVFIHSMRSKAIVKLGFGYDDVAAHQPVDRLHQLLRIRQARAQPRSARL